MTLESGRLQVVDLDALGESGGKRAPSLLALERGFAEVGAVAVTGHEITSGLVDSFHDAFSSFWRMPVEAKRRQDGGHSGYQRGWVPASPDRSSEVQDLLDLKEAFAASLSPVDDDMRLAYPELCAPNVWSSDVPTMEPVARRLSEQCHEVGQKILAACEEALGVVAGTLTALTHGGPHLLRALNYLPVDEQVANVAGAWAAQHTDFSLLTVLPGERYRAEDWSVRDSPNGACLRIHPTAHNAETGPVEVALPRGRVLVQVGQLLESLTGGRMVATPHSVQPVPHLRRLSAAYFLHLHPLSLVYPLPHFRTALSAVRYRPPLLSGTYASMLLERWRRATGLG